MNKFVLAIAPIVTFMFITTNVVAQTATESSQGLRDSVKQKVEEELSQIKKSVSKKAFLGTITSKSEASITINNYRNETRQALVTTDSTIKLKNSRDGTLKDLTVGDFILVMGDVDSQNTMTAKRLLIITAPSEDTRKITFGKVTTITSNSITIETPSKESLTAKLSTSAVVTLIDSGKSVKAKISDIKAGSTVAAIIKSGTTSSVSDLQIISTP